MPLHHYTDYSHEGRFGGLVSRVPEPTRIHAQLPDGWVATDTGITNGPEGPESRIAVAFWTVDAIFLHPCDAEDGDKADPPLMESLDSLAGAFTGWWSADDRDDEWQPIPTRVTDATVSGFRARYLELRIPATVDMDRCGGRYVTWRNADGAERRHAPGEISRLWIVEVRPDQGTAPSQGPRTSMPLLVIDATSMGEDSPEALRELDELIGSIRIQAPETLSPDECEDLGRLRDAQLETLARLEGEVSASPDWRRANDTRAWVRTFMLELSCAENSPDP